MKYNAWRNKVKQGEFCQILDTLRSHTKLMASLLSKRCYVNAFEMPVIWIVLKHRRFCLFKVLHANIYFIDEHGSPVTRRFHLLKDKSCALMG